MKDKHIELIALVFLLTDLPFLTTCLFNPDFFSNHNYNALIFLGMAIVGLPGTVISYYYLIQKIFPNDKIQKESTK